MNPVFSKFRIHFFSSTLSFTLLATIFFGLSCKASHSNLDPSQTESISSNDVGYFDNYDQLPDLVCLKNEVSGEWNGETSISDSELGEWISALEVEPCSPELGEQASALVPNNTSNGSESVAIGLTSPQQIAKLIKAVAKVGKRLLPETAGAPRRLVVMGKNDLRPTYLIIRASPRPRPSGLTSENVLASLPLAAQFTKSVDETHRAALLQKIAISADYSQVAGGVFSSNASKYKQWLLRAVSPLGMGKESFISGDIFKYGDDSFERLGSAVTSAYSSPARGGLAPMPRGTHLLDPIRDEKKYPLLAILRTINKKLVSNISGEFRGSGHEVMHSVPLTPQQLGAANDLANDGYLSVHEITTPFKNAYGKMVTGKFIYYPSGIQVSAMLEKMNVQFTSELAAAKNENDKIAAIARMVRRCITIHPFGDGNGRSCTVLGVWALARQDIPHSIQWAGEDILLGEKLWVERFRQGIQAHRELLKTL
ncbi:MAG: Fic family protein [Pseudomonadota bacterium]